LRKQVDFFDNEPRPQDHVADTYRGLRRLGLGRSATFAGVINAALDSSTTGVVRFHIY
jgi:hypothetical protein